MRKLVSMVAATAFLASTVAAFADGAQTTASTPAQPLAPGGAAGVHNAQLWFAPAGLWIAGGAVLVAVGTAVVLSNHTTSTPTTTH